MHVHSASESMGRGHSCSRCAMVIAFRGPIQQWEATLNCSVHCAMEADQ